MGRARVTQALVAALLAGLLLSGGPSRAFAFSIDSPKNMAVVEPGRPIPVSVDLGVEKAVREVRYYWYAEREEPPSSQQATPALVATVSSSPPYGGMLNVPQEAVGTMRLLAVAEVTGGRLGAREEFDEVLLRAEPDAGIARIEFEAEKPWRLRMIGRVMELPAVAQFDDGVARRVTGGSAGSSYSSSDDRVVSILPNGLLRVEGNGRATLTVTNRGKQGTLDVVVQSPAEANGWPSADAGPALHVKAGRPVVLDGTRSLDPDGDPLRYQWRQVRGMKVSLLDPNTPRPRFVAPKVSVTRLLRFELQVTDMAGADTVKGADSLPTVVDVWVEP